MTWLRVVLFAAVAGVYSGAVMMVPFLKDTSFQDIGISYEWWVVFAVIVVVNCPKAWEAALKCFLFFLISQPLCYAVQILCGQLSLALAKTYYFATWLPMTVLTLPGGFVAYFSKKQNAWGAAVLGLGNTIMLLMGVSYAIQAVASFPYHLLTALFCFGAALWMVLCLQDTKKGRCISLLLPAVLTALIVIFAKSQGLYLVSGVF